MTFDFENDFLLDEAIRHALDGMDKQRACLMRALAGSEIDRQCVRGVLANVLPFVEEEPQCLATSAR
ncbi:hypothetical protein [Stutzerimonas urumqiensis]|uniref:hypothetical protein n=1 Tax=Stutzerimonas urumqiensis TaxID=638269 RepID=UPI000EAF7B01|nr:hypothetical protein [Stutzerimonas urumqiensis]